MSSHLGSGNRTPVTSIDQLARHHATGERPRSEWKVGTEHEKFAIDANRRPLKYRGEAGGPGIRSLFDALQSCCGWEPQVDAGEVIALVSSRGSIALEPGGQVEMSGAPHTTIHDTAAELAGHVEELAALTEELGVRWVWMGGHPVHSLDDMGWMPKRRYAIMRDYLPTRGGLARHMMQTTCTVQANLDYASEADMARKMRAAAGLSSVATAMFANSPLRGGRPCGYKSFRARIWQDTDPDRTGLQDFFFTGDGPTYEEYARWAVDVPLFFVMRGGDYLKCAGLPFRTFWEQGFEGHHATMEDWELHLSTLFPAVRMKTYIETRTADCVDPELICALPALWKGVLYDDAALDAAWDLVKGWSFDERRQHRVDVAKHALAARTPRGHSTGDLAKELLAIARWALGRQAAAGGYADESVYLKPIEELVAAGQSPADALLAWCAATQPTPDQLLDHVMR